MCHVIMQYIELYNEELLDLLLPSVDSPPMPSAGGAGICIREAPGGEIFLEGAYEAVVNNAEQLLELVAMGNASR